MGQVKAASPINNLDRPSNFYEAPKPVPISEPIVAQPYIPRSAGVTGTESIYHDEVKKDVIIEDNVVKSEGKIIQSDEVKK